MLKSFFKSQTKTVTAAAGILAISILISRFLGLVREGLLASVFGAGSDLDIYFASFRIPDLVYNILIAGGVTVAFLPLFSEYFAKSEKDAWEFTNDVLNIFLISLVGICFILFIFTPFLLKIIAPGFSSHQMKLAVVLTRLMFLSPIFFGLSSIFSGVLHYFNRFLVYSLCPILYNLGIIFGIVFLSPYFGILGVAIGVVIGAALHFLIQIPAAISCGFKYKAIINFRYQGVKRIFRLMLPRMFGTGAQQINLMVITAVASILAKGSITIFNFANNLQYFPVGIIGVSFAVAIFPRFTKNWQSGLNEEFLGNFSSVFRQIFYLIFPISVLIFILRNQIVRIVLQHGHYSPVSAQLTSAALGLFCFNIFALSLIPMVSRVFFSFQDTKTPTVVSIFTVSLNIVLSIGLTWILGLRGGSINPFLWNISFIFQRFVRDIVSIQQISDISVLGLPIAFGSASILQLVLLMFFLYKKIGDFRIGEILNSFLRIVLAGFLMIIFSYLSLCLIRLWGGGQTFWGAVWQIMIVGIVGFSVYFLFGIIFHIPEQKSLLRVILKKK